MKRAAIYVRVSTEEQSVDNQLKPLENMALSQNYMVTNVYKDTMSGGAANRPGFQQMLKDARMRRFDILLVWSMDRFSREGISETLAYLQRLKNQRVAIRSLTEPLIDTSDDGAGEIIIAVMAWLAKRERQRISERTKAGMLRTGTNHTGRPKGSKDSKPRKKLGYYKRWDKNGG